jgi:hypothetical protein
MIKMRYETNRGSKHGEAGLFCTSKQDYFSGLASCRVVLLTLARVGPSAYTPTLSELLDDIGLLILSAIQPTQIHIHLLVYESTTIRHHKAQCRHHLVDQVNILPSGKEQA